MPFRRVAPQVFENTEGYIVQVGSRWSMEYLEGERKAIVETEFTPGLTYLYKNRVRGWLRNGEERPMTDLEKDLVLQRIMAALKFEGSEFEVCTF